jgi:ubiquinone/menaquinone biosynthesis C-methylase UbiE
MVKPEPNYVTTEHTWDAIATSFDATRRKPWPQCLSFITTLKPSDIAVDIACGNGRHLIPCARQCHRVIGIDISRNLLDIVQKKVKHENIGNVTLLHANAVDIPLEDNTVDGVLFIAALHNIQRRHQRIHSLGEVQRILKHGGRALISVWSRWQDRFRRHFQNQWFYREGAGEFGDTTIWWRQHGLNIPRYYHLYSKLEFEKDMTDAGLILRTMEETYLRSTRYPDNFFAVVQKE